MKKIIAFILTAACINTAQSQCTKLFFSEYIEGSSNNKALEIYNPTTAAIDLDSFTVARFNNGGTSASGTLNFPAGTMIAPGDVYVIGNSSAIAAITSVSDITNAITFFNGDDAIILYNNITIVDTIDAIGKIGEDPGTNWPVGTGATSEHTLVRKNNITQGTKDWAVGITQWDVFPQNTTDSLGAHSIIPCAAPCTVTNSSFSVTECITYAVPSGDETYTTPGTSTVADTIPNHCGADSIMAITVTILPVLTGNNNATICATGSIVINGNTYDATTSTGTTIFTNIGPNNCDSTVTIALNVLTALTGNNNTTICATGSIVINGNTYDAITSTGTTIFTNIGPNNCDSTVTIALNVLAAIDNSVTKTSPTLTANQTGATYQWLNYDNANAIIPNETGISFTATSNGNYAVEITIGNCIDTSACENIATVGISEIENKSISIYPNPTKGLIKIDFSDIEGSVNYTLTSVEGRVIKQEQNVSETLINIDLSDQSKGIYLLKIENKYSAKIYRIVKE